MTGASVGLGLELTRRILAKGHRLVVAVRRVDTLAELAGQYGDQLQIKQLDMADLAQIRAVADRHC